MYDELVKRLRWCASYDPRIVIQDCNEAADAIEDLQKQIAKSEADNIDLTGWLAEEHAKTLWIPVTERLPEENGEYLVVYTLKAIPPIPRVEICSFAKNLRNVNKYDLPKNKPGFYQSDSEYGYYEITGVSHWMPLPELPEKLPEESER